MQLKPYLRPRNFFIFAIALLALNENHTSIRLGPADLCAVAFIEGDLPKECEGPGLTGPHLFPWTQAIVHEIGKESESSADVASARDISVFIVDAALILFAALAMKPKTKHL